MTDAVDGVEDAVRAGMKRAYELFASESGFRAPDDAVALRKRVASKIGDEYRRVVEPVRPLATAASLRRAVAGSAPLQLTSGRSEPTLLLEDDASGGAKAKRVSSLQAAAGGGDVGGTAGVEEVVASASEAARLAHVRGGISDDSATQEALRRAEEISEEAAAGSRATVSRLGGGVKVPEPTWHAPWMLSRVISGQTGAIRSLAVDPVRNEWFCAGTANGTIVFYDLASGQQRLTLTGHIGPIRALVASPRHPYLFSCGEDNTVRCWDLEKNVEVRKYPGHRAGVYALSMHPVLDVLFSAGRDSAVRVWDMRTRVQVHALQGHTQSVVSLASQASDPQVLSGSMDGQIRLWDLAAGKCSGALTHHSRGVRALAMHPTQLSFVSAAADSVKRWHSTSAKFLYDYRGTEDVIQHTCSLSPDGVLISGSDDGTLSCWDYATGYRFQQTKSQVQPGSLDIEACIFASAFDLTGARLITGEGDKTIKIWKPDPKASPQTHPIDMDAWTREVRSHKAY